jgi:hypothetical protein
MKLKTTIAALAGIFLAISSYGQGTVIFNNSGSSAVTDSSTGAKVAQGVAIAGLYFNADLGAVPNTDIANDGWTLVTTTPITTTPIASLAGVFAGGTVTIDGYASGANLLFQVRAWSVGFNSYAEAFNAPGTQVGASNTGALALGGGSNPSPSVGNFMTSFEIAPVPEPSTVVLGLLGGFGALVALRRRK